ncbi:MAG: HigA family addiction module antidote protein [Clostridiales Family XIII bacterium]|jgi:HTH-type transcriptional regulator/antitoxin HigA|nr:HigA family addiction module antidote protein [Clostridiales Family XIII bacterium]
MAQKTNGLSPDLLFHPGVTLRELIDDRGMNQKELATRTGFSPKHISKVLAGDCPVSADFAHALGNVFGVSPAFWTNLQANFDLECRLLEDSDTVTDAERELIPKFSAVVKHFVAQGQMPPIRDRPQKVLLLRKILCVNNLTAIPSLELPSSFRVSACSRVDPYILYAWTRVCEIAADEAVMGTKLDTDRLRSMLGEIKQIMFADNEKEIERQLKSLFAQCGIRFRIIRHFSGAPVHGFIERLQNGEVLLCMTLRQSFAGIFWFTLFHEIAHILNGDFQRRFIDFDDTASDAEKLADEYASEALIPASAWKTFTDLREFRLSAIKAFAKATQVQPFIVIERLQRDKLIPYNQFAKEKVRYKLEA